MKKNVFIKFLALALNLVIVSSSVVGCVLPGGGGIQSSSGGGGGGDETTLTTEEVYTYDTGVDKTSPLALVQNGVAQYDILIRNDADKDLVAAVNEFQGYLTAITGTALPLVMENADGTLQGQLGDKYISIGYTAELIAAGIDTSVVDYDGFVMKTVGDDLYISGNATRARGVTDTAYQRGCRYGVYDFVERFLDVHWLTYDTTYVPEYREDRTIGFYKCDIESTPDFEMRQWMGGDVTLFSDIREHSRQFTGDRMSREYGFGHNTHLYLYPTMIDPEDPQGRTYGQTHPTYFVGGNNNIDLNSYRGSEICPSSGVGDDGKLTTDASVAGIIIKKIKAELATDAVTQDIDYYFIGHNDDRGAICHCETCDRRRNEVYDSGIWVMLLNCIEEEVNTWLMNEQGREVKFLHFAYQYAERPPVKEVNGEYVPINDLVICDKNVGSRIAPISANYNYSFYDERSRDEDKLTMYGWRAVCNLFMIWDYVCNYEEFFWYFPNTNILKDNLKFYKEMGVVYMMNQSMYCQEGIWFDQMRSYISHKLYWNLDWSVEFLIDEFITYYYGAAAEDVKEIYKLFDDNYASYRLSMETMWINIFDNATFLGTKYLPIEFLNRVLTKIDTTIANVDTMTMTHGIEKGVLKTRLGNIRITPMTMILKNYDAYYSPATKVSYAKEYFDFVAQYNVRYLGEGSGRTVEKRKGKYGL